MRYEFLGEKSKSCTYSQDSAAEAAGACSFPCQPPVSVLLHLRSSVAPLSSQARPGQERVTEKSNELVSWGPLSAGAIGSQVTNTYHIWVPNPQAAPLPAHIPSKAHLVNLSGISRFLATLLILILTDHQLYFKHLLLFQKIFKMELLST